MNRIDDRIDEIDGNQIDKFGDLKVPSCEDKINIPTYIEFLPFNSIIKVKIYRNGELITLDIDLSKFNPPSYRRFFYPQDKVDYEILAGMVIVPFNINLAEYLEEIEEVTWEIREKITQQINWENKLITTTIFPGSQTKESQILPHKFYFIKKINEKIVETIEDLKKAATKGLNTRLLIVETEGNIKMVVNLTKALEVEPQISKANMYPITQFVQELISQQKLSNQQVV